jgi:hypothetical protein
MDDTTMSAEGWVKWWRKALESEVWRTSYISRCVFMWLLSSVNYEDKTLPAGEMYTTYQKIAAGIAPEHGKHPSQKQIRLALDGLKRAEVVEANRHSNGRGCLHVKVLHWDRYQGNGRADHQEETGQQEGDKRARIEKELRSKKEEEDISSKVPIIFAHWQAVMDKPNSKLTPDRRARINARIREGYSAEDIMAAIDGCRASSWHMGENPRGTQYNDFDLICRNGSKLEQFMAAKDGNKTALQVLRERWSK